MRYRKIWISVGGQVIYGLSGRITKDICLEIEMMAHLPGFCSYLTFIFVLLLLRMVRRP